MAESLALPPFSQTVLDELGEEAAELLRSLAEPVVEFTLQAGEVTATDSYAAGHPFMRPGAQWPMGPLSGKPMTFLVQVNFAQVPAVLPGFPTEGLVQWFIDGADDLMGLVFGEASTGRNGLVVRYYSPDELEAGSAVPPTHALHYESGEEAGPLIDLAPKALAFTARMALPHGGDLSEGMASRFLDDAAQDMLDNAMEVPDVEAQLIELMMPGFSVGGTPVLIQGDPRLNREGPTTLLLQLDSDGETFMWGDVGTAQLFGDPEALARGDVSSCWWDWACS